MPARPTRRAFLELAGRATVAGALFPRVLAQGAAATDAAAGSVEGDLVGAKVGRQILAEGGNAIDAAVAAALAAGIATPYNSGLGGYGGHALVALAGGRRLVAVDFNSAAPAQARADLYPVDLDGRVAGNVNNHGWLAAGVPGVAAGLELLLTRFGTRPLREVIAPAIELCEGGQYARAVKGIDDPSAPQSAPAPGQDASLPPETRRNRDLARLLRTLAGRGSFDSLYRGDFADRIAEAFQRHGGLVTRADLAAYRAREVAPLTLEWNGITLHTVPLTATGLLVLQAIHALKSLGWEQLAPEQRLHAKVEAMRLAWADRLATWGDPEYVDVPVARLLSAAHASESAAKIRAALAARQPVPLTVEPSRAGGTTNIAAADRHGNLIAVTVTHGGGYGARVFVPGLGLMLGHGMSRFDPRPGRPNSPGPGKRPINNMCPTVATRAGVPVLAAGGAGGTRIPNSLLEVLLQHVGLGRPLEDALASPRLNSYGPAEVILPKSAPAADEEFLRQLGYRTSRGPAARISAVARDPATGATRGFDVRGP